MTFKKFLSLMLIPVTLAVDIFGLAHSQAAFAATPTYSDDVCNSSAPAEVKRAAGCEAGSNDALPGLITGILNGVILVSGLVAVVFVIIGGVGYMTSTGDVGKIQKAKNTILYACIGLAVCMLSFAIVNFVISNLIGGNRPESTTPETSEEASADEDEASDSGSSTSSTNANSSTDQSSGASESSNSGSGNSGPSNSNSANTSTPTEK